MREILRWVRDITIGMCVSLILWALTVAVLSLQSQPAPYDPQIYARDWRG